MQTRRTARRPARPGRIASLLALAALLPGVGAAEEGPEVVPLDQLLRIPSSAPVKASIEKRGGATRAEWQERFREARNDLATAEETLAATRKELEEVAGDESQWQMTAPGLGGAQNTANPTAAADAPLDYQLSQSLKRQREAVDQARRRLLELRTEANLAGVPDDWREDEPADR